MNSTNVNAFNSYSVNQIFDDHLGTLWFASYNGVIKLDKYKQQFQTQIIEPLNKSDSKGISGIIVDTEYAHKLLWVSTYWQGLICYEPKTAAATVFRHHSGNSISNEFVNSMVRDDDRKIWLATSNGLNKFDPETKLFTVYKNIPEKNSLPMNDVNHLVLSKKGNLWMTVRGNGFCYFNLQTKNFKWYPKISDENNDSINNSVFCLMEDHTGNIWGEHSLAGCSDSTRKQKSFSFTI